MTRRRLALAIAAVLAAVVAGVLVVVALQPVANGANSSSTGATGTSAPSGREGGFDDQRITATPTPAPTPPAAQLEPPQVAPAAPPSADPAEAEVLALVNAERQANGCSALNWDETLAQVARLHSADMAARDFFDHINPEGQSPFDRAAAAGTSASAENIAAGQQSAADAMASWMASDGHRANILDCSNTRLGVGVGHGGSYGITWTQLFGR